MNKTNLMLFLVVVVLASLGLIMVYSSSSVYAREEFGSSYYFLYRQFLWLFIGGIGFTFAYHLPYTKWKKASKSLMLFSIFLLVLSLSPLGHSAGGARRWIRLAGFTLQPSEIAKLFFVIYVADFLSRKKEKVKYFFKGVFPPLSILSVFIILLLLQPDFGAAALLTFLVFLLIFIGGGSPIHIFTMLLLSLPVLYHLIFKVSYRRERIFAFLNPYRDAQGAGFQLVQSIIAVGSGKILGKGLGASRQKLFFLPSSYNDFIFSIIAEELGFVGATIVIILYILFIVLGFRIVLKAKDNFGFLLASGIVFLIALQAFINIGVSIGMLPTKGLCLPFISYGGSSLVVNLTAAGILLNIGRGQS